MLLDFRFSLMRMYQYLYGKPAILDDASDVRLQKDAVIYHQLEDMAAAPCRLEVRWQVGNKLFIKHSHLITGRIRHDHLSEGSHMPVIELLHHPLSNVEGGMAISKWHAAKNKSLSSPRGSDVV